MQVSFYPLSLIVQSSHDDFGKIESGEERDNWVDAIRSAKSSLLVTLQAMNPNSTLTSSTSTAHLRRALQALPHDPSSPPKETTEQRRGKVNHFVPAIWVPDGRTNGCMRCGGGFGWRRRRHHCRLCGRVVCANCSGRVSLSHDVCLPNLNHLILKCFS